MNIAVVEHEEPEELRSPDVDSRDILPKKTADASDSCDFSMTGNDLQVRFGRRLIKNKQVAL